MQLVPEFYNNVCALLPLLMLTKVVDRHRRQHMKELAPLKASGSKWREKEKLRHQVFLVLAAATEAVALVSAGWDHGEAWSDWVLIFFVAVCGVFFTVEVVLGKLAA